MQAAYFCTSPGTLLGKILLETAIACYNSFNKQPAQLSYL